MFAPKYVDNWRLDRVDNSAAIDMLEQDGEGSHVDDKHAGSYVLSKGDHEQDQDDFSLETPNQINKHVTPDGHFHGDRPQHQVRTKHKVSRLTTKRNTLKTKVLALKREHAIKGRSPLVE